VFENTIEAVGSYESSFFSIIPKFGMNLFSVLVDCEEEGSSFFGCRLWSVDWFNVGVFSGFWICVKDSWWEVVGVQEGGVVVAVESKVVGFPCLDSIAEHTR
jgi:hypothetical protein